MENFNIERIRAIIGLGNPGAKYASHRHNIGFIIVNRLAEQFAVKWDSLEYFDHSEIYVGVNHDTSKMHCVHLVKPMIFMNNSGKVIPVLQKKGITADQVLVVHDELEKPFSKLMISFGGSARGHNGLRSIISLLGKEFWRFRFGIGRPERKEDVSRYVLSDFNEQELQKLQFLVDTACDIILQKKKV
jgi:PTH1 family peptidyl-tRNA hydrolase